MPRNQPHCYSRSRPAGWRKPSPGRRETKSEDLLEAYLKGNGGASDASLTNLLGCLVGQTPTDPVAGSPVSLMSRMANADFAIGAGGFDIEPGGVIQGDDAPDLASIGIQYENASSLGFD